MVFVTVNSKGCIGSIHVVEQRLKRHLTGQLIHPVGDVRRGPVDGLLKTVHRLCWQLNLAMAHLAVFQFLDVFPFKGETLKVQKLWRIAEALNRQIAWELAQRVEVRCEFDITLWTSLDVYRAEDEHFVRSA